LIFTAVLGVIITQAGQRLLHPFCVEPVRLIFVRVRAARFFRLSADAMVNAGCRDE